MKRTINALVFLISILIFTGLAVTNFSKKDSNVQCFQDTVFIDGTKIHYEFIRNEQKCKITISKFKKQISDTVFLDNNCFGMVPKFLYQNQNELFLLTGHGFNYRIIYRYYFQNQNLCKSKTQYDVLEIDENRIYYPYLDNGILSVLVEDIKHHFNKVLIQQNLEKNEVNEILLIRDTISFLKHNSYVHVKI